MFSSNCEHIVQREEQFCLRCQCMYEARNTTLIKVCTSQIKQITPGSNILFSERYQIFRIKSVGKGNTDKSEARFMSGAASELVLRIQTKK